MVIVYFIGFYDGYKTELASIAKKVHILGECKLIIKDEVYEVRKVENEILQSKN